MICTGRARLPFGDALVAQGDGGVCFVSLRPADEGERELRRWRDTHARGQELVRDPSATAEAIEALERYGRGELRSFELPLDPRGTPFQRACWKELLEIPYGSTRTYGQIALRLGKPGASRAVGAANGQNALPILIPCHRVVGAKGLCGFAGGLHLKTALLELEGVLLPF